ncbi:MAG: LysR family transcriptional regulator [Rubritepida sp.]|nr:LysR family transcriptional regulator [Rubritepida sp.]
MPNAAQLNRLAYFVAVVDAGSFTAAATRLGVSKAVVSQQIARLEEALGATLIARTTRRSQPTAAGLVFHARCVDILRQADDAISELGDASRQPSGPLRITASFAFGTAVLAPFLSGFVRRYPAVTPELVLSDARVDMVEQRLDLAFRVGWLIQSGAVSRRLNRFEQVLVASPAVAMGAALPEDLAGLPWIANLALKSPLHWRFTHAGGTVRIIEPRPAMAMNSTLAVHGGVRAGAGISVLPDFLVAADLEAGRLVRLLPEWRLPAGGIHVVFPPGRFRPAQVRAFVDMLVASRPGEDSADPDPS